MTVASGAAAAVMVVVAGATAELAAEGDLGALVQLATAGVAGLATFLAAARALAVQDLSVFRRLLPG